jgi:hypothetical protein
MTDPTPDFRALCADLLDCLEKANWPLRHKIIFELCVDSARAALATPPPEPGKVTAWMYQGEDDFDGIRWRENWEVTLDEKLAHFKSGNKEPIPFFQEHGLATPPPEPPPSPDLSALAAIGERLRTQDNRCTAHPAFQVRGLRRIYGMDPDYATDTVWLDNGADCIEAEPPDDPENPGDFFIKTGYQDHWEVIMVAFSEQACLDFIEHNGHRCGAYRELEVYADSFYRCPEMLAIREALMALPKESTPPPKPPTVMEILELSGEIEDAGIGHIDLVRAALERWGK